MRTAGCRLTTPLPSVAAAGRLLLERSESSSKRKSDRGVCPESIQGEMRRTGSRVLTRVPPGPHNPLGKSWLELSLGVVGIHGTNAPLSIYRFATHGCIRLAPDDVEALYMQVSEGDIGRIIYEPVLVAYDGTDVYLEVHPDPVPERCRDLSLERTISSVPGRAGGAEQ